MLNIPGIDETVYARVKRNVVTEYPVSELHIRNRSQPKAWYTPCRFETKPVVPEFHYLKDVPKVVDGQVLVGYEVIAYPLATILTMISPSTDPMTPATPALIADVPAATLARVAELATLAVQSRLDAFATTKGYDSISAAITYLNSSVVGFSTDAGTALALRDQTWNGLYTYLAGVTAGTTPVPVTEADIFSTLPVLAW